MATRLGRELGLFWEVSMPLVEVVSHSLFGLGGFGGGLVLCDGCLVVGRRPTWFLFI